MRNYYSALELNRDASDHEIEDSLVAMKASDPVTVEEATPVLTDPDRRQAYDRVHAQMSAFGHALPLLVSAKILDTNHWDQRLVEFSSEQS